MGFNTETTNASAGGDYDKSIPSANMHAARFVGLVDLGHHDETYNNQAPTTLRKKAPTTLRKILYLWEIMDERRPSGEPFILDGEYTWMPKMGKKSGLRKMLEGWQGQAFPDNYKPNLVKVVGQPCLLNIGHSTSKGKGNAFAQILGISRPMPGQQVPEPTVPTVVWDLIDNGIDLSAWPDWLKDRYMPLHACSIEDYVGSSYEGRGLPIPVRNKQAVPAGGPSDDDIPY